MIHAVVLVGGGSGVASRCLRLCSLVLLSAVTGLALAANVAIADPTPSLVSDINEGDSSSSSSSSSSPAYLTAAGPFVLFRADDGEAGAELWKSDGTEAGTALVADIAVGAAGSLPAELTVVGETVYFAADDGVHGVELWKSDGTAAGTVMVKDILPDAEGSVPRNLASVNGVLYFVADDGVHGREAWRSDGSAAGTTLLGDIRPGSASGVSGVEVEFVGFAGAVYFGANDGIHGQELWKFDGMTPQLVKDIRPGATGSSDITGFPVPGPVPFFLTPASGKLFLAANDGATGKELWVSDGTTAGTHLVRDLEPGPVGALSRGYDGLDVNYYPELVEVNGAFFFSAFVEGNELWRSDGTDAGTIRLVTNLTDIRKLTGSREDLFFSAGCGHDGTGNHCGSGHNVGWEPWISDGTRAGTRLLRDINQGTATSYSHPDSFTYAGGGETIFVAYTSGAGRELWRTDGTWFGTSMIADLAPGVTSSLVGNQPFVKIGGRILFAADDAARGTELWSIPEISNDPVEPPPPVSPPPPTGLPASSDGSASSASTNSGSSIDGRVERPSGVLVSGSRGVVRGRALRLTVGCSGGAPCPTARVAVRAKPRRARGWMVVARGRLKVATNHRRRVKLRLTRRGRALLADRRRATVRIRGAGIASATVTLRILR